MKKIMILEANSTAGIKLLKCANKVGYITYVVTHKDIFEQDYTSYMKSLTNNVFFTNFVKREQAIEEIVEYAKKEGIDGIVAGFEFMSDIAVIIANKLCLPTHNLLWSSSLRRKDIMKQRFEEKKVPCARSYMAESLDDVKSLSQKMSYPFIVKPISNAGSCGVCVVNNTKELICAFNKIIMMDKEFPHDMKLKAGMLMEEFLEGEEYSVELAIQNQKSEVLSITKKMTTSGTFFAELGHTTPAPEVKMIAADISSVSKKACSAIGLQNGVAHVELKKTDNGFKVIEIGARLPGDMIPELIFYSSGIDMALLYLKIAVGEQIYLKKTNNMTAAIRFFVSEKKGTIKEIQGVEDARKSTGVLKLEMYKKIGDRIDIPQDNIERIGFIIARADTFKDVEQNLKDAMNKIIISVD